MQMLHDCIQPENLEAFKKLTEMPRLAPFNELKGGGHCSGKTAAAALDAEIRRRRDEQAEEEDRARFEKVRA